MNNLIMKIKAICKKYDLPTMGTPRDNVILIMQSAEVSAKDKLQAFDMYDILLAGVNEKTYTTYAPSTDMTFIMKETYKGEDVIKRECVGWYYGAPDEGATESNIGRLTAEY